MGRQILHLPLPHRRAAPVTAIELDDHDEIVLHPIGGGLAEDVIPGPPLNARRTKRNESSNSRSTSGGGSAGAAASSILAFPFRKQASSASEHSPTLSQVEHDELQLSRTEHLRWSGGGILANREDLDLPEDQFAAGCNLLQAAARGDVPHMRTLLESGRTNVNFRDYDRRTALHVAASEGHLNVCQFLVERGAKVNRSDRWGGSPLDDAHRHRHADVIHYLRDLGASTGSGNRATNLITAAASGDVDEVKLLLHSLLAVAGTDEKPANAVDVNKGDYDKRTALHLAAGEGHSEIVRMLCLAGADVNAEDRWYRRPLDDAIGGSHRVCCAHTCAGSSFWLIVYLASPHQMIVLHCRFSNRSASRSCASSAAPRGPASSGPTKTCWTSRRGGSRTTCGSSSTSWK
jgi:ankyrin repeat protein